MKGENCEEPLQPFLKWAGGKRWLVSGHSYLFERSFQRYTEPFLGSGAIFFHLAPSKAILSDANDELIQVYRAVREDWKGVEGAVRRHHHKHSAEYYYKVRSSKPRSSVAKAARFIYLNRTCWNGLYRVNLKGQFNVPIGTKTNVIMDSDDFESVAKLLKHVDLRTSDFELVMEDAGSGDLIFVDPPYTVNHNLNGFVKYNEILFSWNDQIRLRDSALRAARRGAVVLLTNAYHESVRKLYRGIGKHFRLDRRSVLAADSNYRKKSSELLVIID